MKIEGCLIFKAFMYFCLAIRIMKPSKNKSALKVQKGIQPPDSINPNHVSKRNLGRYTPDYYVDGIINGNRALLSRAITLIESTLPKDQELAQHIIEKCLPYAGKSLRIGITGVPGVGKSTFIEALGILVVEKFSKKLAVLAIDPSSARSKGSILGDKTRMEKLAVHTNAFIRPSPSAGSLGGVAQKTRESIVLCEAAGYKVIFVETVGVGQSETAVHAMVDFFLLLMLAGAGDELQGIKRGIMEMADALIINKADGDNYQKALLAKAQYANALHLFPTSPSGWETKTAVCSSKEFSGIEEIWKLIEEYQEFTQENGYFHQKRREQDIHTLKSSLEDKLQTLLFSNSAIQKHRNELQKNVADQKLSPYQASEDLLQFIIENFQNP